MRDLVILFVHIIATLARLLGPGGILSVVAESVLIRSRCSLLINSVGRELRTARYAAFAANAPCFAFSISPVENAANARSANALLNSN